MRDADAVKDTRRQVRALIDVVGQLAASLLPGTAKSWRAPQVSAARRAELDRQAREELDNSGDLLPPYLREKQGATAPGEAPVPYDLDVADQLQKVSDAADRLALKVAKHVEADLIAWAGRWARDLPTLAVPPATSAFSDPRPALRQVLELLSDVHDPDLLEHIADHCHQLVDQAQTSLGLVTDGQLLTALCPSCGGKTSAHPVGGARTLRIRTLPGSREMPGRPVVVCEGGRCDPDTAACGIRWKGLPAWDLENEGEWLARWITKVAS